MEAINKQVISNSTELEDIQYTMETGISANEIEFSEFCRFRQKYKHHIMKIQRKMDYFNEVKMLDNIKEHLKPLGNGKGGTYFAATGCGKTRRFDINLCLTDNELFL